MLYIQTDTSSCWNCNFFNTVSQVRLRFDGTDKRYLLYNLSLSPKMKTRKDRRKRKISSLSLSVWHLTLSLDPVFYLHFQSP